MGFLKKLFGIGLKPSESMSQSPIAPNVPRHDLEWQQYEKAKAARAHRRALRAAAKSKAVAKPSPKITKPQVSPKTLEAQLLARFQPEPKPSDLSKQNMQKINDVLQAIAALKAKKIARQGKTRDVKTFEEAVEKKQKAYSKQLVPKYTKYTLADELAEAKKKKRSPVKTRAKTKVSEAQFHQLMPKYIKYTLADELAEAKKRKKRSPVKTKTKGSKGSNNKESSSRKVSKART